MCGDGILSEYRSSLNTQRERCSGIPKERLSQLAARFGIKTLFQTGSERTFGYMGKLITQTDGRAACRKRSFPRNALCLIAGGRHLLSVRVALEFVEPRSVEEPLSEFRKSDFLECGVLAEFRKPVSLATALRFGCAKVSYFRNERRCLGAAVTSLRSLSIGGCTRQESHLL